MIDQFEGFHPLVAHDPRQRHEATATELTLAALRRIASILATAGKDEQWAEEEEWRLVVLPRKGHKPRILRREVAGRVVEYLEIPVRVKDRPLALKEVLVGPCQNQDAARRRLQRLLTDAGYPHEFAEFPAIIGSKCRGNGAYSIGLKA